MATWPEGTSMSMSNADYEAIETAEMVREDVEAEIKEAFFEGYKAAREWEPYYKDEAEADWKAHAKAKGFLP